VVAGFGGFSSSSFSTVLSENRVFQIRRIKPASASAGSSFWRIGAGVAGAMRFTAGFSTLASWLFPDSVICSSGSATIL
jgi:hypothetical protein